MVMHAMLKSLQRRKENTSNYKALVYEVLEEQYDIVSVSRYSFPNLKKLHYDDNEFYSFIYRKLLIRSSESLVAFMCLILGSNAQHYSTHLRFLNCWEAYLSMSLVLHHYHLVRSYLILLHVVDVPESELALQNHLNIHDDGYAKLQLKINIWTKVTMERQIVSSEKRLSNDNDWFWYEMTFEEFIEKLYSMFTASNNDTVPPDRAKQVIPPVFSMMEWIQVKAQNLLDAYDGEVTLKRVRDLEALMESIGMMSFRQMAKHLSLNQLNERLFNYIGIKLTC
ncbi:uncharacterized protein CYBJADRAFT_168702 [Cyberlindnera jadinii NRRL Y-1542]|uniref:Uncharacterized protein n=1 Tax=Cyberlindnera jadinii (strain ATCC 18201 / CBS 1600 / BCRC 20928 / JCM 3617 / NBRC 0987 / NRRL Y-1542) TaxID=983966 RepID=A0A1E4RYP5_CYBJN|nr:hypothetical protein CYBJADRAFT_168702 [Cyberlindnera jadinii NRRL Y-1542]ODV72399.1 hypothetical protein CYBJADRAFT_168702 [Cyberlindnera jadinii NRRL Y-1542]